MSNSNAPDSEIERKLSPGEKLLWSGQPRQGFQLRSSDLRAIPFSLLFCGFAIFWEFGAFSGNAPLLFKCVGSVFVLIGLYLVAGRFFVDSMMRKRTSYGVTSERIIILNGFFSRRIKSLSLQDLPGVIMSERSDGSGTIVFGPQNPLAQNFPAGWPGRSQYVTPTFEMIERAKETYDLIIKAEKSAKGAEPAGRR